MEGLLVVNAGSSSLKFQLFDVAAGAPERRVRGQVEGVGGRPRLRAAGPEGETLIDRPCDAADLPAAIALAEDWLASLGPLRLRAMGHRVVHGGAEFDRPVLIDPDVLERLAALQDLAPLHQPNNLAPIRRAMAIAPEVPQVACFDTAFHRGRPAAADCFALPWSLYEAGVRRYGFHGLSYDYVAQRLRAIAPDVAAGRVVVAHLGSGASMCALRDGRSVESTMGFTALDGLPMGTRPGQLDPGVVLHLIEQRGMDPAALRDMLYRDSGLKGLSGLSGDMRDLLSSEAPRARLAVEHFARRCVLNVGMLAAALGGLDALVFTAGIGERAAPVRAMIAEPLGWLGVRIDPAANEAHAETISPPAARVRVMVIPTDEEAMIARQALALTG